METIKKILFTEGHYFAWKKGDLHTEFGMIKETDLKKAEEEVKSNIGKEFKILEPGFTDLMARAKRGPQIILNKDVGVILTNTDIDKDAVVVEAGSGSGFLTCQLGRFVKKVISYERREDFLKIAEQNTELVGLKNITFKQKDIYEGIEEKNIDLVFLDLPEPQKVVQHAYASLKKGGYFVTYLPGMDQVGNFIREAEQHFFVIKIIELLEREWHVESHRIRPASQMIGHTGFLCFLRKM